ncbi:cytochrome P450 [Aspergillus egyptiacus]|nr:cytochrome P450 [Aspergillus egyptiacus]
MGTFLPFCGALLLLLWYWICARFRARESREQARRNIILTEPPIYIPRLIRRLQYLWNGPEILWQAHVKDAPYAILTPETYQVQFSSAAHIKQLVHAPDTHLSLHALAKDTFQFKYTADGLRVDDCMSANGTVHQRALQSELRSHLPALRQPLSECIAKTLTEEIAASKPLQDNWRALPIFPMAKRLVTSANALVFFGTKLSSNPTFLKAALEYPEHLMETAEALRLIPSWLAPFLAPYLMRGHGVLRILLDHLIPTVEHRLHDPSPKHVDCIQFLVNAVIHKHQEHQWPAQHIAQVLLGIWFASVHQPAMCLFYALDDLCLHPEYLDPLRNELSHPLTADLNTLPFLNAFLKESARLHPTDSISLRRKVLQPFTLSDGTRLATDDIACVPLRPILQDPETYMDPLAFNPYRFVDCETGGSRSKFADADVTYPIWGLGKRACPGRHYASLLLKMVLAEVVCRYEVRMPEGKCKRRFFYWRSAIVPRAGAVLLFRERDMGTYGVGEVKASAFLI